MPNPYQERPPTAVDLIQGLDDTHSAPEITPERLTTEESRLVLAGELAVRNIIDNLKQAYGLREE